MNFTSLNGVLCLPWEVLAMLLLAQSVRCQEYLESAGAKSIPSSDGRSLGSLTQEARFQTSNYFVSWFDRDRHPRLFTPHVFETSVESSSFADVSSEQLKELKQIEVAIEMLPLLKLYHLVQEAEVEISWNMLVRLEGGTTLKVYDLFFPYQEGLPSHFDVSAAMKGKASSEELYGSDLSEKEIDSRINDCRLHGHSHVWMGTEPSQLDQDFILGMLQRDKPPFFLRCIANKRGRLQLDLYLVDDNLVVTDLPWRYEWSEFDEARAWAKDQIARKLTVVEQRWDWMVEEDPYRGRGDERRGRYFNRGAYPNRWDGSTYRSWYR